MRSPSRSVRLAEREKAAALCLPLRRPAGLRRHDRKRADCNDVAAMILPAAIGQSTFDGALLASGGGHHSYQSIGACRYCAPAARHDRQPARDIIPAPRCHQGIPSGLEKSDAFHHTWNWDDEHIINGNDHAWNTRYVATSLQSSARGFILTRRPILAGGMVSRRECQGL
jgi:hypothetical protein